jgi:hypothetical protein
VWRRRRGALGRKEMDRRFHPASRARVRSSWGWSGVARREGDRVSPHPRARSMTRPRLPRPLLDSELLGGGNISLAGLMTGTYGAWDVPSRTGSRPCSRPSSRAARCGGSRGGERFVAVRRREVGAGSRHTRTDESVPRSPTPPSALASASCSALAPRVAPRVSPRPLFPMPCGDSGMASREPSSRREAAD